jgi:transposase-like protein
LSTVSFIEIFGVDRVRFTIHNLSHKADLQPESGRSPNHITVDKTVIQLGDEQNWLYAAVDSDSKDLLYTKLETTRTNVISNQFFRELRKNTT